MNKCGEQMATIEEIQKRREARRKSVAEAHDVQFALDLERLDQLEEEHGFERVLRVDLQGWDPGIGGPTMVIHRVPKGSQGIAKKLEQVISTTKEGAIERLRAYESFARATMVYPNPDTEAADLVKVLETAPGVLAAGAMIVWKRVQGDAKQEGKG